MFPGACLRVWLHVLTELISPTHFTLKISSKLFFFHSPFVLPLHSVLLSLSLFKQDKCPLCLKQYYCIYKYEPTGKHESNHPGPCPLADSEVWAVVTQGGVSVALLFTTEVNLWWGPRTSCSTGYIEGQLDQWDGTPAVGCLWLITLGPVEEPEFAQIRSGINIHASQGGTGRVRIFNSILLTRFWL